MPLSKKKKKNHNIKQKQYCKKFNKDLKKNKRSKKKKLLKKKERSHWKKPVKK